MSDWQRSVFCSVMEIIWENFNEWWTRRGTTVADFKVLCGKNHEKAVTISDVHHAAVLTCWIRLSCYARNLNSVCVCVWERGLLLLWRVGGWDHVTQSTIHPLSAPPQFSIYLARCLIFDHRHRTICLVFPPCFDTTRKIFRPLF